MSDIKLTPKQEAFARKYIELGNASEAYRQCYDAENMKDEVIWVKASELLSNGKVAVRVNELKAEHAKRHAVTVDSITTELEEARKLAMRTEQPSAAVTAALGKAKLHGLLVDKTDMTLRKPINEMTDSELNDEIAQYERAKGAVLPTPEG